MFFESHLLIWHHEIIYFRLLGNKPECGEAATEITVSDYSD